MQPQQDNTLSHFIRFQYRHIIRAPLRILLQLTNVFCKGLNEASHEKSIVI